MEAIIFCGIQATGKSTFFKERFFRTHMHISLDMLNTRYKEEQFLEVCFRMQQPFVVDNTNPSKAERARYISLARQHKFKVVGYYFQSKINDSIARNNQRTGKEKIPENGIRGTSSRLELPSFEEGFDEIHYVEIAEAGFIVKNWTI